MKLSQLAKENVIAEGEKIGEIIFDDEHVIFLHTRSDVVDNIGVGIFRNKQMIHDNEHQYDTALVLVAPKDVEKVECAGLPARE